MCSFSSLMALTSISGWGCFEENLSAFDRRFAQTCVSRARSAFARGSAHALEVSGEVRPGAAYPTAGTFFFANGEIMKSTVDLSAKKTLSFQLRGDGFRHVLG